MRRVVNVLPAALLAITFGSMVFAFPMRQAEKKPAEKAAVKTENKPTALAATGTVAKFDAATKTLTLTTKDGAKEFTLGANAKIMAGAHAATTADLGGRNVKVTYANENGKNVASKVTIAGTHAKPAPEKEPEKK
jgi:hypothetical protein